MSSTGGTFTAGVDDFFVDELPLYDPSGEGEHCYISVQKKGLNTRDLVKRAIEVFGVSERDVGTAGMKDRHATTTQMLSILGISSDRALELQDDGVEVLSVTRHRNKLKTGHLRGNRFRMRLRSVTSDAEDAAQAIFEILSRKGMANYFGPQRFGRYGDNAQQGHAMLSRRGKRVGRWKGRLLVSALQSALFNQYVDYRLSQDALGRALAGDVMRKCGSGGQFICTEPEVDQSRIELSEISPTGPMFGWKMKQPAPGSEPHQWESSVLAGAELTLDSFRAVKRIAEGTRRPLRIFVEDPTVERSGEDLWVSFSLPSGSYATVVISELTQQGLPTVSVLPIDDPKGSD
jgi:tRNA pseudouridine13 synthase